MFSELITSSLATFAAATVSAAVTSAAAATRRPAALGGRASFTVIGRPSMVWPLNFEMANAAYQNRGTANQLKCDESG
jgi:hypothetical protein